MFPQAATFNSGDQGELYDLEKDPYEMQNQYANPKYAEVVVELKAELRTQRANLNETDAAYPELKKIIDANWN